MFDRFESHFVKDATPTPTSGDAPVAWSDEPRIKDLLLRFAGASFNLGLYRVMAADAFGWANDFVAQAFPAFSGKAVPFGYDWLGRIFALDPSRLKGGSPAVVMFEPGTGEGLEIPCNLLTFHENELIDYRDEALAVGFHRQWLTKGGPPPKQHQCVGYRQPLFLAGKDVVENLELSDLDVYWTLSGQLIRKARGLPPGTRIENIKLYD
jgi:hypothetical protein